jgi:hypothetical protein
MDVMPFYLLMNTLMGLSLNLPVPKRSSERRSSKSRSKSGNNLELLLIVVRQWFVSTLDQAEKEYRTIQKS